VWGKQGNAIANDEHNAAPGGVAAGAPRQVWDHHKESEMEHHLKRSNQSLDTPETCRSRELGRGRCRFSTSVSARQGHADPKYCALFCALLARRENASSQLSRLKSAPKFAEPPAAVVGAAIGHR